MNIQIDLINVEIRFYRTNSGSQLAEDIESRTIRNLIHSKHTNIEGKNNQECLLHQILTPGFQMRMAVSQPQLIPENQILVSYSVSCLVITSFLE